MRNSDAVEDGADYERLEQTDELYIDNLRSRLQHTVCRLLIRQKDFPSGLN